MGCAGRGGRWREREMARATAERLLACRLARPEKESAACTSTRLFTRSRCLAWLSFFSERAGPAALLFPVHHQHFLDIFLHAKLV